MPIAIAQFLSHLLGIDARTRVLVSAMSHEVAAQASSDDIRCRVGTIVPPCLKMLCGALEPFRLRRLDLAGLAERFEIAVPHRQTTVVAAAQLGKVCGMTMMG